MERQFLQFQIFLNKGATTADAQQNCCKRSIKIYIKTAPTCFSVNTIIREHTI